MRHARVYSTIFWIAAVYNLLFGLWAGLFPGAFFELFDMDPPRWPMIWQCLGMVIGIYALGYAYAAWKPERGAVLIALGLLGKVLGPIGWVWSVATDQFPARTFPLILFNDLIWWVPFGLYLREHWRVMRAA